MHITRRTELPANLPPRGLGRFGSAHYLGVGVTLFDQLVRDGRMPKPVRINNRAVWDRLALDAAFEALSDRVDGRDPWEGAAA